MINFDGIDFTQWQDEVTQGVMEANYDYLQGNATEFVYLLDIKDEIKETMISQMVRYFEAQEDYEKCNFLKSVENMLEDTNV